MTYPPSGTSGAAAPRPGPRPPLPARALSGALALVAAAALLSPPPHAQAAPSLWESAVVEPEEAARALRYAEAMELGLDLGRAGLDLEASHSNLELSPVERLRVINRAIQAFEDAGKIDPTAADPPYYLASLLTYGKLECRTCDFEPQLAAKVIASIDAFEKRAPLDPRLSLSLLTKRAIYHTRLAGLVTGEPARQHLVAALADYRTAIERYAGLRADNEIVYGNMAETLMMLGDVEGSIEQYRQALRVRPSTSITLGLAVALDRDERGTEARSLLRDLGSSSVVEWEMQVSAGDVFYVPEGEVYYYRGLVNEAFGNYAAAIESYNRFIQSKAHPQFTPRATANRDALRAKRP